jgi:hypothetical protein
MLQYSGADAKAFFDEVLPMFSSIVRDGDLERFAQQPDSKLPRFSYVGPILHRGRTTCLLGTVCTACTVRTARMHAFLLH